MSKSFQIRTDQVREGFLSAYDTYQDLAAGWFDAWLAEVVRAAKSEALREVAYEFAEGAWQDQWSADAVECDVTAVRSTYRWFVAKADQIEQEVRHVDQ